MIETMGVILTGNNESDLAELTRVRSVAAVPYGGRYRLIDFILSNFVNSGIVNVGVATEYNYQSLLDHLGSGKPWGLARKKSGLRFLPHFLPYNSENDQRISMLFDVIHYLKRSTQKYVIVADCNNVCNMRFDEVIQKHVESGAELTIVYQDANSSKGMFIDLDGDKVKAISSNGQHRVVGYYVFTKELLITFLEHYQMAGHKEFYRDLISEYISRGNVLAWRFDGYLQTITDTNSYYKVSMDLMKSEIRKALFISDNRILTKVKDKVPTRYLTNAQVSNSFIADGCTIDGKVENSILFRGVSVEEGADVSGCIVMQDVVISPNVRLSACIIDKDCVILKGKELVGQAEFPIVVGKHRTI